MEYIWLAYKWVAPEMALFPISNRGLKYGDGLFESFRVIRNHWIYQSYHWERLVAGAKVLQLQLPKDLFDEVNVALEQLEEKMPFAFCSLRIFRAGKGKYTPQTNQCSWFIEAVELAEPEYPQNSAGITTDFSHSIRLAPTAQNTIKSANALPYVLASLEKSERGLDDLILPGPGNNLVEATSANIFLIRKNSLITPPLSQGCLDGVLRRVLLEKAKKDGNLTVCLEPIFPADLEQADELWLTNTGSGIRWVKKLKNHTFAGSLAQQWQADLNLALAPFIGTK